MPIPNYFLQVEEPFVNGQESSPFGAVISEHAVRTAEATMAVRTSRRRRIMVILLKHVS